jgi:hypothetical protein
MIIVFAGAGASKAVDRERYPTTVEFFQRLPTEITSRPLYRLLSAYLGLRLGGAQSDIEHLLWSLDELRTFLRSANDPSTLIGWFVQNNRLAEITGNSNNLGAFLNTSENAAVEADMLWDQVNRIVYDLYSHEPDQGQLEDNWLPLLRGLEELDATLELVTTNYDAVLEKAVEVAGWKIDTGRSGALRPQLNVSPWRASIAAIDGPVEEMTAARPLLTKLHGSVDWSRSGETIYTGTPLFQGSHDRHVIIYPGFKGVPAAEPFNLFHSHFERVAKIASAVVFVGFAFRDEHINTVLSRELPRGCRIGVINPDKSLDLTVLGNRVVYHVDSHFDRSSVEPLLAWLRASETKARVLNRP